jgi:hypothetical protein
MVEAAALNICCACVKAVDGWGGGGRADKLWMAVDYGAENWRPPRHEPGFK